MKIKIVLFFSLLIFFGVFGLGNLRADSSTTPSEDGSPAANSDSAKPAPTDDATVAKTEKDPPEVRAQTKDKRFETESFMIGEPSRPTKVTLNSDGSQFLTQYGPNGEICRRDLVVEGPSDFFNGEPYTIGNGGDVTLGNYNRFKGNSGRCGNIYGRQIPLQEWIKLNKTPLF